MNLNELYEKIKYIAQLKVGVNSVYLEDPYTAWNTHDVKYGSLSVYIEGGNVVDNIITYNVNMYWGDRITETGDNIFQIQSEAINIINDIVLDLEQCEDIVGIGYNSFTVFKQKFVDFLAGAYTTIQVSTPKDNCIIMDSNI